MYFISSEALLEMYFLQATLKELGSMYGKSSLRIIKPSPQDEKWVGIDQAWVSTEMTDKEFLEHLKGTVSKGTTAPFYFAVFRQYKRVEKMTKASDYTPYKGGPNEWPRPYYRCDLYTEIGLEPEGLKISGSKKAKKGGPNYSQHEALIRLSALSDADVHYACPMIFTPLDVWQPPDMNQVRLVTVKKHYPTYANDGKKHHLCFRNEKDLKPEFHSEFGTEAESRDYENWQRVFFNDQTRRLNAKQLLTILFSADALLSRVENPNQISEVLRRSRFHSEEVWEKGQMGKHHLARDLTSMLSIYEISPN